MSSYSSTGQRGRQMRRLLVMVVLSFVGACYHSPILIADLDAAKIRKVSDKRLCNASVTFQETRGKRYPTIEAEISRRGLSCGTSASAFASPATDPTTQDETATIGLDEQSFRARALRNVNMRRGPGTDQEVIGVLPAGYEIAVLRIAGSWCECMTADARRVYVSCGFLSPPKGGWASSSGAPLPRFVENSPYPQVRRQLISAGWEPYRLSGRGVIGCRPNEVCMGFPETAFCTGTGQNSCWYTWRRRSEHLLIVGLGEAEGQAFGGMRRCSTVVYSDEHPWQWCRPPAPVATAPGRTWQELVGHHFKGWVPRRASQFCGDAAKSSVSGDFNGDGVTDHAARIFWATRGQIVAFISSGNDFTPIVLEQDTADAIMGQALGVERRGTTHYIMAGSNQPRRPTVLRTDAVTGGTCEASSYIFIMQGSSVTRAFTSD